MFVWNKKLVVAAVNLLVWDMLPQDKLGFSKVTLTFVTDSLECSITQFFPGSFVTAETRADTQ